MIGSVTSRGSCLISQSCRQYLWENLLSRASSQFASMLSLMLLNFNRMREERLDNSYHCSPTIVMPERSSTSSSHPEFAVSYEYLSERKLNTLRLQSTKELHESASLSSSSASSSLPRLMTLHRFITNSNSTYQQLRHVSRCQSNTLLCARRTASRVSSIYGLIESPPGGFVTTDIKLDINTAFGGTYARSVFASRDIGFGREIMNIPAFSMYIGEGPEESLQQQVIEVTRDIFNRFVIGKPEVRKYIMHRVLTLMSGGFSYFTREADVYDFAENIRAPGPEGAIQNGAAVLSSGEFSSYDLQKLPLIIEFNRFDVEYRGRRGVCLFPEASYFNHSCDANVELSVTYNSIKNNFYLSARTIRPIKEGEEVVINYMPGNTLPLSRFSLALRRRWGFECFCPRCKDRMTAASIVIFALFGIPIIYFSQRFTKLHSIEKRRKF